MGRNIDNERFSSLAKFLFESLDHTSTIDSPASSMEKKSRSLCEKLNATDFSTQSWLNEVSDFAENTGNRLIYSTISDYVFGLEQRDRLTTNVKQALNDVYEQESYSQSTQKMVVKIYDHINLAIRQKDMTNKSDSDLRRQIEEIVETKSAAVTKEMTTQLVSLIAIFTALSFIVFGGISSLDSIFQSLQTTMEDKNTILPTLIVSVVWAFCLMNLLFGFMYFVLRIAKQSPSRAEKQQNIVQRYPVVFLCDYVLLLLFVVLCGSWFAERNGVGQTVFSFFVCDHHEITFIFAIVLIAVFFSYLGCKLYALYKGTDTSTKS